MSLLTRITKISGVIIPLIMTLSSNLNADTTKKTQIKKCFGENNWICFTPKFYTKNSIGDGEGTPLKTNILQSQAGVEITSEKSNWALELNWSLLGIVLRDSVQSRANESVEALIAVKGGELQAAKNLKLAQASAGINQALVYAGLQPGSEAYNKKYNMLYASAQAQVKHGFVPYDTQLKMGEQAALDKIEKRSDDQELRTSLRDIMLSYDDNTYLFRTGWGRAGQGFDRHPLGDSMLDYTATGSPAIAAQPGTGMQALNVTGGRRFTPTDNIEIKLVAWVNQNNALFINGTQYLANAYRESEQIYSYYNDIAIVNAGGASACSEVKSSGTNVCFNVQASAIGVTPGLRLEQKITEDLVFYTVASIVGHSYQASGAHARVQLTYNLFHGANNFDVYVSVFAETSKKHMDFSLVPALDLKSDGNISNMNSVGGAVMAKTPVNAFGYNLHTDLTFGVQVMGTKYKINEGGAEISEVAATGSMSLNFNGL